MNTAKVSVILPVFNGEKYLRESIDSVLSQSYKDFELIIWDDASTDDSAKIVANYCDLRIKLLKNTTNQGLFRTLNLAINKAQGEYIRLWSYDDIMKPHCLQTEFAFHKQHPEIGMSYCARDIIDASGKVILTAPDDKTPELISPGLAAQIMFYYGSIAGNISTATIKKEIFDEIGFFREDMQVSGDFDMWVRISNKYTIGFIRQSLIYLRSHIRQFSRWRGMGFVFMKEDKEIIQSLIRRLPAEIVAYAKVYNRWKRHISYVHYMIRLFLEGDFKTSGKVYREISHLDNPFLLIGLWAITANGRWFKKKPRFEDT